MNGCPEYNRKYGINLMSDNSSRTSISRIYETICTAATKQAFTSLPIRQTGYDNLNNNVDTETFITH